MNDVKDILNKMKFVPEELQDEVLQRIKKCAEEEIVKSCNPIDLVVQRLKDFGQHTMAKPAVNLKNHFNLRGKIVFAKTLHYNYEYLTFLTNQNNLKKIKKELVLSFKKFPTVIMNLGQ